MFKILHARVDEQTGCHFCVLAVAMEGRPSIDPGTELRCAGYRFAVESVHTYPEAPQNLGVLLSGRDAPREGMILHLASEPLTAEEFAAALRHLLMIPAMLKAVDAKGVRELLEKTLLERHDVQGVGALLIAIAAQVEKVELPSDRDLEAAARYVDSVLGR